MPHPHGMIVPTFCATFAAVGAAWSIDTLGKLLLYSPLVVIYLGPAERSYENALNFPRRSLLHEDACDLVDTVAYCIRPGEQHLWHRYQCGHLFRRRYDVFRNVQHWGLLLFSE